MTVNRKNLKPGNEAVTIESESAVGNPHHTYLMPFVIFSLLALPVLTVLVISKNSIGYTLFVNLGYFGPIKWFLWLCVIISSFSALAYFVLARGKIGKIVVAVTLAVLLASFIAVMQP